MKTSKQKLCTNFFNEYPQLLCLVYPALIIILIIILLSLSSLLQSTQDRMKATTQKNHYTNLFTKYPHLLLQFIHL